MCPLAAIIPAFLSDSMTLALVWLLSIAVSVKDEILYPNGNENRMEVSAVIVVQKRIGMHLRIDYFIDHPKNFV